jgi:hypothetical protein
LAALESVDDRLRAVLEALDTAGLRNNTDDLVIFRSPIPGDSEIGA